MTDLAVRRLFANGAGLSEGDIEIEDDHSIARRAGVSRTPAWRAPRRLRLLSLTPFAVPVAELVFVRDFLSILMVSPPDIVGVPLSLALELMLLLWAALGATLVWRTGSKRLAEAAVILFAPTAIVGLILRPDVIDVMRNLTV